MARLLGTNLKAAASDRHGDEELLDYSIRDAEGEEVARRAIEVASPGILIEMALENDGTPRADRLGEHLSDSELDELLTRRDLWPNPIEAVAEIEDDPDKLYAWILRENATEDDRASLAREIEEAFIGTRNKTPDAVHLIINNVSEIEELDSETVKSHLKPWLNNQREDE